MAGHFLGKAFSIFLFFSLPSHAFDTGHHSDLTRSVLSEHAFGEDAIKVAQITNWLTDYYSSSPTAADRLKKSLEKLHFDNLFSSRATAEYWGWFLQNVKTATRDAASKDDPLEMLTVIGIALHAVQDFYAHSNWVESLRRVADGPYRTQTFLSARLPKGSSELVTGTYPADRKQRGQFIHGAYDNGLNKDSHVRPLWDEAYVFAYCGSHELISIMGAWAKEARPGFWEKVQRYVIEAQDRDAVAYDLEAVRNISMWVKSFGADGHWKGNLSGNRVTFLSFLVKWVASSDSIIVKTFKSSGIGQRLAENLYSGKTAPPAARTEPLALKRRAIIVRVDRIEASEPGQRSFYSLITVGTEVYRDRVLQNRRSFADQTRSAWYAIHFIDSNASDVAIKIAVWDEDGGGSKDRHVDINAREGERDLQFKFRVSDGMLSGDVNGVHRSRQTAVVSSGSGPDSDRATIGFYVTQFPLLNP